jgi:hypothetical protein
MGQPWEDAAQAMSAPPAAVAMQPWEQAAAASPASQAPSGYGARVSQDFQNIDQQQQDAANRAAAGQQSPLHAIGDIALDQVGKGGAVVNEAAKPILSTIATMPGVDLLVKGAKAAGNAISNIPLNGSTLGADASQEISQLRQNHPVIAGDVDAALNAGGGVAAMTGAGELANMAAPAVKAVGSAVADSGAAAADAKQASFLQDLITPKQTPSVKNDLFTRSTQQGILGTRVAEPTAQEQGVISSLANTDVSPMKSLNTNYNIISDANDAERQALGAKINALGNPAIGDDDVINAMAQAKAAALKNPASVTSDGTAVTDGVINKALDALANNDQTAAGVLQARRDFDSEISRFKGENVFDPALENPISEAVRQARQGMNNLVAQAVPNADVLSSLQKQSNLYRAMDAIETKGGAEGKNVITRMGQKAASLIPAKTILGKIGVGTAAATGTAVAPVVAGGLGAAYVGGKALMSPLLRKAVGSGLYKLGQAADIGTNSLTAAQISGLAPAAALQYLNSQRGN